MKRQNREWGRGYEERRHHLSFKEKNMRLVDSLKVLNFGTPTNRRLPQHVLLTSEKSFILKEEMTFFRFNPLFTSWFWLFPVLIGASNFKQLVVCVSSAQSSPRSGPQCECDTPLLVSAQCPHITPGECPLSSAPALASVLVTCYSVSGLSWSPVSQPSTSWSPGEV